MARTDGRIEPGQPLETAISARAWNRAQDAADIVLGSRPGLSAGTGGGFSQWQSWVYARFDNGVLPGEVVQFIGCDTAPPEVILDYNQLNQDLFSKPPVMVAATGTFAARTSSGSVPGLPPWGLSVEPVRAGGIGRVVVAGCAWARIRVWAASDAFADCDGQSCTTGTAHILWKQSGTGENKWALLRLGTQRGMILGQFTAPWPKDEPRYVSDEKSPNAPAYWVVNDLAGVTGSGTRRCRFAWAGDRWAVFAVEC